MRRLPAPVSMFVVTLAFLGPIFFGANCRTGVAPLSNVPGNGSPACNLVGIEVQSQFIGVICDDVLELVKETLAREMADGGFLAGANAPANCRTVYIARKDTPFIAGEVCEEFAPSIQRAINEAP